MKSHQLVNQNSGKTEYYTPSYILDKVRLLFGVIDLDPASCPEANERVKARHIYTKEDDGLSQPWFGNVWLNHPFGRDNKRWLGKLVQSYEEGDIKAACCITFNALSERWAWPLLKYPQCFPHGRVHYIDPTRMKTSSATKGSVITYLGLEVSRFAELFEDIGTIKIEYRRTR